MFGSTSGVIRIFFLLYDIGKFNREYLKLKKENKAMVILYI